jgi:hypothetical protein
MAWKGKFRSKNDEGRAARWRSANRAGLLPHG